ncbi:MAG: transcriptional coactivator hfi1/ADA1 [Bogoriella megaspora]|nr:MAG: transcriptional coactivator hfi1/ADA1 [Bogoriella megaspora]
MNPADLQRTDTISHYGSATPSLASKGLPPASKPSKPEEKKTPRVDVEPIYTGLKQAIGENWAKYKDAIGGFVQGHLTPTELHTTITPLLSTPSSHHASSEAIHLHNNLLIALYTNLTRDPPDTTGPAPFVSANDKPTTTLSKGAPGTGSDAFEARNKSEVMHLPARERHRLKHLPPLPSSNDIPDPWQTTMREYQAAKSFRLPEQGAQGILSSTSGASNGSTGAPGVQTFNKTNIEGEIKKRYLQALFSETLEFPEPSTIIPRLVPMCYEAGLTAGPASETGCAEFITHAAENYIKEALTSFFARVRTDGEGYVQTAAYRRRRQREEEAAFRGFVTRGKEGLLPVEVEAASRRRPLAMGDLRLALEVGDAWVGRTPLIASRIAGGLWEEEDARGRPDTVAEERLPAVEVAVKGLDGAGDADEGMERDFGWMGGAVEDRRHLDSVLDECLAVGF